LQELKPYGVAVDGLDNPEYPPPSTGFLVTTMTTTMTLREIPLSAKTRHEALIRQLSPAAKVWVNGATIRVKATGRLPTDTELRATVRANTWSVLGSQGGQDIEALAFLVMMEAAKSAREDLKAAMDAVRHENEKVNAVKVAPAGKTNSTKIEWPPRGIAAAQVSVRGATSRIAPAPAKTSLLSRELSSNQEHLDNMGDMTQLMQMRLQKYLDAYSKMFEMLSNVMKKMSATSASIVQNLK
jgi:hypothetical protein